MCSYQRVNNSYNFQNSKILNVLLKTELGFEGKPFHFSHTGLISPYPGYIMTDWEVQYTRIASFNAGLDMAMLFSDLWRDKLTHAIKNGSMEASRLDDMVIR